MKSIHLPRLISDGMIVQRDKKLHIYGWVTENIPVKVSVIKVEVKKRTNLQTVDAINSEISVEGDRFFCTDRNISFRDGEDLKVRFDAALSPLPAGGPYIIEVKTEKECIRISDVYSGDLYSLAGQSNIELPMNRVLETYPEEAMTEDPLLRVFKVTECGNFHAPLRDHRTGIWKKTTKENLQNFTALGYFFAKSLREKKDIPVGIIDTTLGGSTLEAWMSKEMLASFPHHLITAEKYADDDFIKGQLKKNAENASEWDSKERAADKGLSENWMSSDTDTKDWDTLTMPVFFKDSPELKGFIGCIWLKKHFNLTDSLKGKNVHLYLGTMTDADTVYINGTEVGRTFYKYPPRRYAVPEGLLREGENEITIRLSVQSGCGLITPGKVYALFTGDPVRKTDGFKESIEGISDVTDLTGEWKYRIGCKMSHVGPTDFVNWKPTALFNGMLSPCTEIPVKGFVWYQGESNTGRCGEYKALFESFENGLRKLWKEDTLPVFFIKLPEFDNSNYEPDESYVKKHDWEDMQKVQEKCALLPYTYMIESVGTGEINDLHPQRKKPLGEALAMKVTSLH